MKSLRVIDGDIALGAGNRASTVTGKDKLVQDLKLWLLEPFGTGFQTPNFGSLLHEFIGTADPWAQVAEIEEEVRRVIGLYQAWQAEGLRAARDNGQLNLYQKSEVLSGIESIESAVAGDRVTLRITVSTLSDFDESLELLLSVGLDGVNVATA